MDEDTPERAAGGMDLWGWVDGTEWIVPVLAAAVFLLLVAAAVLAATVMSQRRELDRHDRDVRGLAPQWDAQGYLPPSRAEKMIAAFRTGSERKMARAAGSDESVQRWKKALRERGPLVSALVSPLRRSALFEPVNGDEPVALAGLSVGGDNRVSAALFEYHGGLTVGRVEDAADTLAAEWGYPVSVRRAADGIVVVDIGDGGPSK